MRDRLPLVLSTAALLVALLGTPLGEAAYEAIVPKNSVGAEQLRPGAVTNAKLRGDAVTSGKVKDRSLKAIDFAEGQLPAGPPGPKGDKGDTGKAGLPGLSGYEIVSKVNTVTNAFLNSAIVECPTGKKAIGGGYLQGVVRPADGPFLDRSHPFLGGTAWSATAVNRVRADWTGTFYAVCATVAP